MSNQHKRIMVIGGGISGLSSAYYTQKLLKEQGITAEITLVEKSHTLGGKIQTLYRDDCVIERGPDSFLARKTPIIELTKELGLEHELTATNPIAKKNYILKNGRFHRMPQGLILGIPTEITPFMKTSLISPLGKIRAAMDLILPRRKLDTDESLGAFLERRLGKEVLAHIAEPLLAGIYAGDTNSLSLKATFPQFQQLEHKYRSLILGMIQSRKNAQPAATELPLALKGSMFLTYKKGLKTLVDALIDQISEVKIKKGINVDSILKIDSSYRVILSDGHEWNGDVIIAAIPTHHAAQLLSEVVDIEALGHIPYVSVANVIIAFDKKEISHPLDGSGFVIPRTEGRFITACTWTSSKWLHSAPQEKVLLRCYIGRSGDEKWMQLTDEEIVGKVQSDLLELMGISAEPQFHEITRWENSMPQYPVEHLEQIVQIREQLAIQRPGIYLTGSGYQGVGIPDCIHQGKIAAGQAAAFISH